MLRSPKEKICECGNHFIQYNSLKKYCSFNCEKKYKPHSQNLKQKTPIRKVSVKQDKLNKIYSKLRIEFLSLPENQICPITKQQKRKFSERHQHTTWYRTAAFEHHA